MEACLAVEKEVDRVLSKFTGINDHAKRVLADLVVQIQNLKEEYQHGINFGFILQQRHLCNYFFVLVDGDYTLTSVQIDILKENLSKVKHAVSKIATDHRDLHSTVSKVGKAIDRNFVADYAATSRDDIFRNQERINLINKVICQHYYRQGMHDVAEELGKEADIVSESQEKEPFTELNHILDRLKAKDLEPALAWATVHHDSLEAQNSSLEFNLHKMKFIELLRKGAAHQTDAISYARTHFRKFVHRHEKGELIKYWIKDIFFIELKMLLLRFTYLGIVIIETVCKLTLLKKSMPSMVI